MTPALAANAVGQLALFALVGWLTGDLLLSLTERRRSGEAAADRLPQIAPDWPERALVATLGFVVFAVAAMVLNIVLGGAVFGTLYGVPLLALALLGVRWKRTSAPRGVPWRKVAIFILVVVVLWCLPTLLSGTAARSGDTPWHLGWTEQLLAGQPVPEGPAPAEVAANAYPWGFHALLATLVRLVPGSDVLTALVALQLLLPVLISLGAACLARRVVPAAGWAAATAAAAFGGFGWVLARAPIFFTSPTNARFGADLTVASPNAVYELFPPPSPREVALVVLAAAAVLLCAGLLRPGRAGLVLAGIALGCVGLISVPTLVAGVAWTGAALLVTRRRPRTKALVLVAVPALLVFGLWAGPVVAQMIGEGGFVNITPSLGREWPLWTALGSWGLLVPLAGAGVWLARGRKDAAVLAAFALVTAVLLGLAILRGELDWSLAGNATTLHQGRFWPVARLLAATAAGIALWSAWQWLTARRGALAYGVVGGIVAVGSVSPALGSVALTEAVVEHHSGYSYRKADVDEGSFLRRAAAYFDPEDLVAVRGPSPERNTLAFYLFAFSGVRLAEFDDPRLARNDLRIRYKDLAARWDERARGEGFQPDYEVVPVSETSERALLSGDFDGITWVLLDRGRARR